MIINCQSPDYRYCESDPHRVFVDGVQIKGVWYIDTEAGLVRTYHVAEGVGPILANNLSAEERERGFKEGWDMSLDHVVSKTIYGVVELKP